jgi:hypothetical protein
VGGRGRGRGRGGFTLIYIWQKVAPLIFIVKYKAQMEPIFLMLPP